jgi:hypothetical protein
VNVGNTQAGTSTKRKKKKKELKAETSVVTFRLPMLRSLDDLARQIGLDVQKFKEAALPDPA